MIGNLLLIAVLALVIGGATLGAWTLALYLALRAPAFLWALIGIIAVTLLGFWLRSMGV